jgi:hypothetical protein
VVAGGNSTTCTGANCTANGGTDGADTINGGAGNDHLVGGNTAACTGPNCYAAGWNDLGTDNLTDPTTGDTDTFIGDSAALDGTTPVDPGTSAVGDNGYATGDTINATDGDATDTIITGGPVPAWEVNNCVGDAGDVITCE